MEVFITSILSLCDLAVTVWLARSVTTLLANERFQKEYLIKEIDEIRSVSNQLCIEIYNTKIATTTIQARYKDLIQWVRDVDTCIQEHTGFDGLDRVINSLNDLRNWLTGLDEYNQNFSMSELQLSSDTLSELESRHRKVARLLFTIAMELNKYRVEKEI